MLTPYSLIFEHFLASVGDDLYFLLPEEDAEKELIKLMNLAIPGFRRPRVSLRRDDEAKVFFAELTDAEIEMIVFLMMEKWLFKLLMEADNFEPMFKDKDYQRESSNQTVAQIRATYKELIAEKRRKLIDYTRIEGSFTGLAGKEG